MSDTSDVGEASDASENALPVTEPIVRLRNFQIACPPGRTIFECPGTHYVEGRRRHLIEAEVPKCLNIPCKDHPFERQGDERIFGTPQVVNEDWPKKDPYEPYNLCFECRAHIEALNLNWNGDDSIQLYQTDMRREKHRADEATREEWMKNFEREARLKWAKWRLYIGGEGPKYYWEKKPENIIREDPLGEASVKNWGAFRKAYPLPTDRKSDSEEDK